MDLVEIESDAGITVSPTHSCGANGHWVTGNRVCQRDAIDEERTQVLGIDCLDPLRFVDDVPRQNLGLLAVALEQRAKHQVEERGATVGVCEHSAASAHLHASCHGGRVAPQEVEEDEEDSDAVATRDVEGGVHVPEYELVEALWPAAFAESDARASVAEQEPPRVTHPRRGELREGFLEPCTLVRLRHASLRPPRIGAEVDAVMDPR